MRMSIEQQMNKRSKDFHRLLGHLNPKTGKLYTRAEAMDESGRMLRAYQDKYDYYPRS